MIKKILLANVLILLLTAAASQGAEWVYYIQYNTGEDLYIDTDSLKRVSPDIVTVTEKVIPKDSLSYYYMLIDVEVDCKKSRMKIIKKITYHKNKKPTTTKGNNLFRNISAEDDAESLLELVCSLKKSRN